MRTWGNVLISHIVLVIPMSYPCHYTNLCPHLLQKGTDTHTHTHAHTHTHTPLMYKQKHSVTPEWEEVYERGRRKIVERQRDLHPHCSTDAAETDTLFMLFSCECEIWNKNKAHMVSSELWDTVILSTHTALMTEADSLWSLTHWVTLTSCFMFRIRNDQDIKVIKALKTDSA